MKLTRQHRREARLLWRSVTIAGVPDAERIQAAVQSLRQRIGREAEAVLRCFAQRLAVYIRAHQINIVSADPLSAAQQAQMEASINGADAVTAGLRFSVDASVIGGLRLERGYQVVDRTIARQLEVLQGILMKN